MKITKAILDEFCRYVESHGFDMNPCALVKQKKWVAISDYPLLHCLFSRSRFSRMACLMNSAFLSSRPLRKSFISSSARNATKVPSLPTSLRGHPAPFLAPPQPGWVFSFFTFPRLVILNFIFIFPFTNTSTSSAFGVERKQETAIPASCSLFLKKVSVSSITTKSS